MKYAKIFLACLIGCVGIACFAEYIIPLSEEARGIFILFGGVGGLISGITFAGWARAEDIK